MKMKPIRMIVVESTTRPGELSIRAKEGDPTATPIFKALNVSGAKAGDVLELCPAMGPSGHEVEDNAVAITRVLKRLRPLAEIGQRVINYFADTGECLLCDVDADRENGGPPVHEEHCNLAPVCGEGQEGKEPKSDSVSAALPVDQGGEPR